MFYNDGYVVRSSLLDIPGVAHCFSTRLGGVSTLPHTTSMNIARGHGDSDETVLRNTDILVGLMTDERFGSADAVCAHQIHSAKVRVIDRSNCGEGNTRDAGEDCDGYVTDISGVVPIVRTADCVPIIMCAERDDGTPVVSALHAGWRGTVAGIAAEGVRLMCSLGADVKNIRAAIGPHIDFCCFEVGEDLLEAVISTCGEDFARRHIRLNGTLHADLTGMNREILLEAGVSENNIDFTDECTCCLGEKYHSHRRGKGKRGTMGSGIVIL